MVLASIAAARRAALHHHMHMPSCHAQQHLPKQTEASATPSPPAGPINTDTTSATPARTGAALPLVGTSYQHSHSLCGIHTTGAALPCGAHYLFKCAAHEVCCSACVLRSPQPDALCFPTPPAPPQLHRLTPADAKVRHQLSRPAAAAPAPSPAGKVGRQHGVVGKEGRGGIGRGAPK